MGMNMDSVGDVKQVIIRVSEQAPSQLGKTAAAAKPAFSEEDVQLVADQTGKSLEKAKEALQECGGDLAKAILLLQS